MSADRQPTASGAAPASQAAAGPAASARAPLSIDRRPVSHDELAVQVVLALHRLAKQSTFYTTENEAQRIVYEQTQHAIYDYGRRTGKNPKIFFSEKAVFVGRRLLRAGRAVYSHALELGAILRKYDVDEVAVGFDVGADELRRFQEALADAIRHKGGQLTAQKFSRIRLRRGKPPFNKDDTPEQKVVRTYATSIVVMRRFFELLQKGEMQLPQRVRRIAQQLSELGALETPAFLGITVLRNTKHDHAGLAVNAALLGVSMARQITQDKRMLSRIAMSALLYEVGKVRIAGAGPTGEREAGAVLPRIAEHQQQELPAATAVLTTALGGLGEAAVVHTVLAFEALHLNLKRHCKQPYGGLRAFTLEARIVGAARRFSELLAEGDEDMTPNEALRRMRFEADEPADKMVLRFLACALGLFVTGMIVELTTGELAQVIRVSLNPLEFPYPTVLPVVDASGGRIADAVEIDLAQQAADAVEPVRIVRVVAEADDKGAEAMRAEPRTVKPAPRAHASPRAAPTPAPAIPREAPAAGAGAPARERVDVARELLDDAPPAAPGLGAPRPIAAPWPVDTYSSGEPPPSGEPLPSDEPPPSDDLGDLAPGRITMPSAGSRPRAPRAAAPVRRPEPPREEDVDITYFQRAIEPPPEVVRPTRGGHPDEAEAADPASEDDEVDTGSFRRREAERAAAREAPPSSGRGPLAMPPVRHVPEPPAPAARAPTPPEPPVAGAKVQGGTGQWVFDQVAGRRASAQGQLAKTPLVHLLVYALDQKLSGTVLLTAPDESPYLIFFQEGVPCKVRTAGMVSPLDRVLLEMGLLDERTLQASLTEISRTGQLHGRYLVSRALLDSQQLLGALGWQLVRKVGFMFTLPPETSYAYFDGVNLLADYGGPELTPCEPLGLVMNGVRLRARDALIDHTLARIGAMPLKLHPAADTGRLLLKEHEQRVVDLLRERPHTLAELFERRVAQERVVQLTVYALAITRTLQLGGKRPVGEGTRVTGPEPLARMARQQDAHGSPVPGRGPTPMPRAPTPMPRAATPTPPRAPTPPERVATPTPQRPAAPPPPRGPMQPAAHASSSPLEARRFGRVTEALPAAAAMGPPPSSPRPAVGAPSAPPTRVAPPTPPTPRRGPSREEIEKRGAEIEDQNFFEVLGLGVDAAHDAIQAAYLQIAKIWHPDRMPEDVRDLKPLVARIFARINEAYQTLNDAGKRQQYLERVKAGAGTVREQEMLERVVDSALLFQKAEVLFKKGNYASAEQLLRQAIIADPEQPEYVALLAWVQASKLGEPPALAEGDKSHHYREQIKMLDDVLAKEPEFERALFYRGMLLKRTGWGDKAMRDFRLVAKLNPRNIDAAREVRLHDKRTEKQGSLLGRFFGGKPPEGGGKA